MKSLNTRFFQYMYYPPEQIGWFRLFGYGLHIKNVNLNPLLFSERNGHTKYLRIGKWIITVILGENK